MQYTLSSDSKNTRYPISLLMLCMLTATIAWHAGYLPSFWYGVMSLSSVWYIIKQAPSYTGMIYHLLLLSTLCTIGIQRSIYQTSQAEALYKKLHKKTCCIEASVMSIEYSEGGRYNYVTILSTHRIKIDTWQPARHTIHVYTTKQPNIAVADLIKLEDISIKKPNNQNFCRYLLKEGVAGTCFLNTGTFSLISRPAYSIKRWLHSIRTHILHRIYKTLTPTTALLFRSVFMGKRSSKNKYIKTIKHACQAWGVSHHLARSGLHLLIIVLVWQLLLKALAISLYKRIGILLFLISIYQLLTWPSISFFRALWAFFLHHICVIFGIPSNNFYLLTLIALVTLLMNPFFLFFLDFQLSFGTALALTWYSTIGTTTAAIRHQSYA